MSTATGSTASSGNPGSLTAISGKSHDTGGGSTTRSILQSDEQQVLGAAPAAISGGESPTEAEFLALRTLVVDIRDALIAVGICKA